MRSGRRRVRPPDRALSRARITAFRIVPLASRFIVSPNSYALRRAARLDAGGHLARVVPAEAALADRAEQVAQRPIAEEVEALVGDLELERWLGAAPAAARPVALGRSASRSGAREVALMLQLLDDLLQSAARSAASASSARLPVLAEQLLEHLVGHQPAVQQRLQNGVVQRLHRMPAPRLRTAAPYGLSKPLESSRSDSLRQQLLEVEAVEVFAGRNLE